MSSDINTLSEPDPKIVPGKKYRFVVRSAEEAVRIIQERMGGKGRVLSVRQIDVKNSTLPPTRFSAVADTHFNRHE